jgi:hypothetical protein
VAGNRCEDCGCAPTTNNGLELDAIVAVADGGDDGPVTVVLE